MPEHFDESKIERWKHIFIWTIILILSFFVDSLKLFEPTTFYLHGEPPAWPVVHDGFAGVEGQSGIFIAGEGDESWARVTLKLDLDIDQVPVPTEVGVEMCDGV